MADAGPAIEAIAGALRARPLAAVPCHNDLLADNFIEQDGRLRVFDWEYSGNGDPAFELGNTCRELDYGADRIEELRHAYFGEARAPLVARVRLHMIVSDVGWALWAGIQRAISRIAFDFEAYEPRAGLGPRRRWTPSTSRGGSRPSPSLIPRDPL